MNVNLEHHFREFLQRFQVRDRQQNVGGWVAFRPHLGIYDGWVFEERSGQMHAPDGIRAEGEAWRSFPISYLLSMSYVTCGFAPAKSSVHLHRRWTHRLLLSTPTVTAWGNSHGLWDQLLQISHWRSAGHNGHCRHNPRASSQNNEREHPSSAHLRGFWERHNEKEPLLNNTNCKSWLQNKLVARAIAVVYDAHVLHFFFVFTPKPLCVCVCVCVCARARAL